MALLKLKKVAQKYKPVQITGVATSAFRTSLNGESVAKYLSSKSQINIKVISQKKEAILGFVGAVGNISKKAEDLKASGKLLPKA